MIKHDDNMLPRNLSYFILTAVVMLVAGCVLVEQKTGAAPSSQKEAELRPGKGLLLVARRDMGDIRFRRTVILIVQHDRGGTMGLVVNRPSHVSLSYLLPDLDATEYKLYYGGPVSRQMVFFLLRSSKPLPKTRRVVGDILAGGNREILLELLPKGMGRDKLRLYTGHAGWAAGQLEQELGRGDWHLLPPDPEAVFNKNPRSLWKELIEEIDPEGIFVKRNMETEPG